MIIDFDKIEPTVIPNFKGGEKNTTASISFDGMNKIMLGKVEVGASIGIHTHETNSEIIYILSGDGRCIYDGAYEELSKGSCHYCPKGHSHSLINASQSEDLIFFAVVPEQ